MVLKGIQFRMMEFVEFGGHSVIDYIMHARVRSKEFP